MGFLAARGGPVGLAWVFCPTAVERLAAPTEMAAAGMLWTWSGFRDPNWNTRRFWAGIGHVYGAIINTKVREAMAVQMVGRLKEYRGIVAAAARGEPVSGKDTDTAEKHLRAFGLPAYAFRRDVRAMAGADTATGYRRAELEWNHPHLFVEPTAWVQDRIEAARRRVRP